MANNAAIETKKDSRSKAPAQTKKTWAEMATERNARVILCHTPDTYMLTSLTRTADRCIRILRDQAFSFMPIETAKALFDRYNKAVVDLHLALTDICKETKVRHTVPESLAKWLESQGVTDKQADDAPGEDAATQPAS